MNDIYSKPYFEVTLDILDDAVLFVSTSGVIDFVNDKCVELFEYKKHELEGNSIDILMPSNSSKKVHEGYLKSFLASGESSVIEKVRNIEAKKKMAMSSQLKSH